MHFTPEMEVELLWIFVLPRHTGMQGVQPVPADTPLDLFHCFLFSDQDPHRLAIQGIARLELSDGEGGRRAETHGTASAIQPA